MVGNKHPEKRRMKDVVEAETDSETLSVAAFRAGLAWAERSNHSLQFSEVYVGTAHRKEPRLSFSSKD